MDYLSYLLTDFYKIGHVEQYPCDVTQVWSNFTARGTRIPGQKSVVFFGLQYFLMKYLRQHFQQNFFRLPLSTVLAEYRCVIKATLGVEDPKVDHIEWLHSLGYLPLEFYAIPEGHSTPLGVPSLVVTNTHPKGFWVPNYIESLLSAILWKPCTSATTAQRFRKIFTQYAVEAGETDFSFIDWQGHDFSFRGMSGVEDAVISGMGHLTSFSGTDTIPAILAAVQYYGADPSVGGSVPATEHSVMCAGSKEGELETFKRLLYIYPKGPLSIVSDTWDLWKVLTEYVPDLKEQILARDGKLIIRPDSGDPVKIICGDFGKLHNDQPHNYSTPFHPAFYGVLLLLKNAMGITKNPTGVLPLINKASAIYGESITEDRARDILHQTVYTRKLSPYNMVFGIGSYTYEYCTRDTNGFAMKATAVRRGDKVEAIFKKPVTDSGEKTSHVGIPCVYKTDDSPSEKPVYFVKTTTEPAELDNCAFQKVFSNGDLLVQHNFNDIRKRVRA